VTVTFPDLIEMSTDPTPSTFFSFFSIAPAQDAQVMPSTKKMVFVEEA
jgi:hypothetical protein